MLSLLASPRPGPRRIAALTRALLCLIALHTAAFNPPPLCAQAAPASFVGFDRNTYPGAAALPTLRKRFSFTGYWLNTPPGARTNTWQGTRAALVQSGFGFLVLWNGRLDAQLKHGAPEALARKDAAAAIAAAQREGFPRATILFLDQEEGGRLLPEQAAYLLAWTEAIAASGFRPGVYASGQPVTDSPHQTITTAQDITAHVQSQHLHPIALWVAQDSCGPSPGCTLTAPLLSRSGTPNALVWQYAQSPRRPEITRSCARTYAADGNCSLPELPAVFLDLNVSSSPDPSHGR